MITDEETDYERLVRELYVGDEKTGLSLIEINLQNYRDQYAQKHPRHIARRLNSRMHTFSVCSCMHYRRHFRYPKFKKQHVADRDQSAELSGR